MKKLLLATIATTVLISGCAVVPYESNDYGYYSNTPSSTSISIYRNDPFYDSYYYGYGNYGYRYRPDITYERPYVYRGRPTVDHPRRPPTSPRFEPNNNSDRRNFNRNENIRPNVNTPRNNLNYNGNSNNNNSNTNRTFVPRQ